MILKLKKIHFAYCLFTEKSLLDKMVGTVLTFVSSPPTSPYSMYLLLISWGCVFYDYVAVH